MKRSIPILLYHHVSPDRAITPAAFERQLRMLLAEGYQNLSMDDLLEIVRGKCAPERPGFVVTMDDGYLNNWDYAFPVLQKLSVKATIYLVTEKIATHADGFLTWDQIRAMARSGLVTFGSHTHTHRHFVRREPYADLEAELRISKSMIETEVGAPCRHLAWPWGDYENSWLPLLQKTGYETAVTTLAGANSAGTSPYALKRINVKREDLGWLAKRCRWNSTALAAQGFGLFYGWDRRFKTWVTSESPYSHG